MSQEMVLHVRCVTGAGGGPEKTILNSPRFLAELGYQCACAYLHPPQDESFGVLLRRADAAGARLISVPDRGALDLSVARRMIRICRAENVAVWHGHDYKSNALGLLARRFWRMKLITTVHGWVRHTRRTPLYYKIDKLCLPKYDEVICVSEDLHEECLRLGVPPSRCHLIHNGIDMDQFRRSHMPIEARRRLPYPAATKLIGAMGRLSEEKGFDRLIRAVGRLVDEGHDIHLWIAGDGDARESLEALIEELGLGNRVLLLGHVEDTKTFFEAIDLFALSSLREGLPNVLLEAMAMEVPVVATRIAGIPSLVTDGERGLLVDPDNIDQLATGLRRLLGDGHLCESLAKSARCVIERDFSFQKRMRKVAEIYDRHLQPGATAFESAAHSP